MKTMAKSSNYHVPFRRRREGKTNFHRRQRLLRSNKPRLVVRRSNKHEKANVIIAKYVGDETIVAASSKHLEEYGWKGSTGNVPSSYLTGYLAGKYAQTMGIKEVILDIGINSCRKGTRVSALLAGAVASGLEMPHDPEVFPPEERYTGNIIAEFAKKLKKDDADAYKKQFANYLERKAKPESLPTYFNATIKAIDEEFSSSKMKTKLVNRSKKNKAKTKPKKTTKPATKKPAAKKPTTTKPKPTTKKEEKKEPAKKTTAKPKPTKKEPAKKAEPEISVKVDKEIEVTYKTRTYTFDKNIKLSELESLRGVPIVVKEQVAKERGFKSYGK